MAVESIGDLARRTGTSRRMLRHWEEQGLLLPARVNPSTGWREYAPSQDGRVRAIVALRTLGFGLDAIRVLLDSDLTEEALRELLRAQEAALQSQIDESSAALLQVRSRLHSLEKGHLIIMDTLTLTNLPEIRQLGATEAVSDESEIPGAVTRLLDQLGVKGDDAPRGVLLAYDGSTDDTVITVSALVVGDADARGSEGAVVEIEIPAAAAGVSVHLADHSIGTADAWIALDGALEVHGLRSSGPYRQTLHPDGSVTFAAPTRPLR